MRFGGKTVLVTGAASGIGRAACLRLAQEGANLVLADRTDPAALADMIGERALPLAGDASDEAFVRHAVDSAVARFGTLDGLFANAGIGGELSALEDISIAEWNAVLSVNLVGVFLAIREAARVMQPAGGGAIVATASVAGLRSGAGGIPYSASKAGVINLVQTSAHRLAGTGVRVNAILPGLTETGMTAPIFDGARARGSEDRLGQLNPLRRPGQPEEPAAAALFLLSDDSSYINGQMLAVDGGLSSSLPTVPGRFV